MESISTQICRSLNTYWRRRKYKKLEKMPSGMSMRKRIIRLGGTGRRKRSPMTLKLFRGKLWIPSPKNLLLKVRDVYVNSMLKLVGDKSPAKREVKVRVGDFEMRLMQHVYNTLLSTPRELTSCV